MATQYKTINQSQHYEEVKMEMSNKLRLLINSHVAGLLSPVTQDFRFTLHIRT